jgi:hypothetical protein
MSLDVYLKRNRYLSYDAGKTYIQEYEQVYGANITHNLGKMAKEVGIYEAIWRPEEINKTMASEIIELLEEALVDLKLKPQYFKEFNPTNGWGSYEVFVDFIEKYLDACRDYPNSFIEVSR